MNIFKLSKDYEVICNWKKTRNGFKHTATLCKNNNSVSETKICYLNRTWESFEYESVLHKVINAYFDEKQAKKYIKKLKAPENEQFKAVSMVCALGEIMCNKQEEKNKFKKRILGTIKGIDFPQDWEKLLEKEKEKRLNGGIEQLERK